MNTTRLVTLALVLGCFAAAGCDLDVPDLNNPPLDGLLNDPDAPKVEAACTGLLIGNRRNHSAEFGYVDLLGILGREAYNFDGADPRFVDELLGGKLDQGSPFGGNFWGGPYANLRLANVILHALDKLDPLELSDMQKSAIRGFVHTIMALDLLEVIATRDTIGAVIDTDHNLDEPLGPIVSKDMVYAEIARLLESALPELDGGGDAFPFPLSSGYIGFDAPPTFRKFNRAIRARVAAYMKDYAMVNTALAASFFDDTPTADFDAGVYYTYSTRTGDTANGLINPNIFVHPSVQAGAQKNGAAIDARYTRKVSEVPDDQAGSAPGASENVTLSSSLVFAPRYPSPSTPVPLIRNEELILLKAEALFFTNNAAGALAELNIVRTRSGKLLPLVGTPNEATFIDELLYEREYSLLFEGHRWIDVRRLNRVSQLPLDDPKFQRNVRFPIPLAECNARPGEPACNLDSLASQ